MQEVQETRAPSISREDHLDRRWQPAPFLPGKFHGQKSRGVGGSGRAAVQAVTESEMTQHARKGMGFKKKNYLFLLEG